MAHELNYNLLILATTDEGTASRISNETEATILSRDGTQFESPSVLPSISEGQTRELQQSITSGISPSTNPLSSASSTRGEYIYYLFHINIFNIIF